jgi:hypothetical protein
MNLSLPLSFTQKFVQRTTFVILPGSELNFAIYPILRRKGLAYGYI